MDFAESIGSKCHRQLDGAEVRCPGDDDLQITDHDTMPHMPPATNTAKGLEWAPSPPNVVISCLLLSYVVK